MGKDEEVTCIVGLVENGVVYMGSDSASSNGWTIGAVSHPKLFDKGEFLIGYTSSFRMGQILEKYFAPPKQTKDEGNYEYLIGKVVEHVREIFKDHAFAETKDGAESGGTFLVGYRGGLYEIQSDYAVLEFDRQYGAVGSGYPMALGSLYSCWHLSPVDRIKRSLQAAGFLTESVAAPYYFMKLEDGVITPIE